MNRRILTDDQVQEAYCLYIKNNKTTRELAAIFKTNSTTMQREFKKAGLALRDGSHCKQKYFQKIYALF